MSQDRLRAVLAWVVIVLMAGPVGAAVWLGLLYGESPCILCWAQRTSMALIGLVGLFVIRYGPRPRYLGLAILLGAWGLFMGLRHSALHLARDVGQGFAAPIFGVHTYVWAWVIHWIALAVIGGLLLLLRGGLTDQDVRQPTRTGRFAFVLFLVVVGANAFQAITTTGPPPFIGQADPVRFSLNPQRWVWSLEELRGRISLRGAWTIPEPGPERADPNPAHGPLANLPALPILAWERIEAPLNGRLTDLAISPAISRASPERLPDPTTSPPSPEGRGGQGVRPGGGTVFLAVTDRYGVYLLDSTLSRVVHHVVLDPDFAIDLSPLAGAAFLGGDTVAVVSTNKSYVVLAPDPAADPDTAWRRFRETDGGLAELRRSRFQTVRARQMYVLSLAYDPEAGELITIGVPSPRHRGLVVSRFSATDFVLSSEFDAAATDTRWSFEVGHGLELKDTDRSLAEYVVTGAAVADGLLYAISAAYSTLLVIDLHDTSMRAAYELPGIESPVGLAVRGSQLLVAQADGRLAVVERPAP